MVKEEPYDVYKQAVMDAFPEDITEDSIKLSAEIPKQTLCKWAVKGKPQKISITVDNIRADKANEDIMKSTLKALANYLYDNTDMQHLLVWELEADNSTTRRMARSREKHYKVAIEEYKNLFEGTGIPIDIIAGLLTAGTYYLILHRKRSTFFSVDYQRKENRERLYSTLEYLSGLVFSALKEHNQTIEIARNFKQKGIADDVIAECTGLSVDVVKGL